MSIVKLAYDNTSERGYDTKRAWKARGKGGVVGAIAGAAMGAASHGKAGAAVGALSGGVYGSVIGDSASKLKQNKEYAQRHGSHHANLQAVNPLTSLRMFKHTSTKEGLKQGDLTPAIYGGLARKLGLKDMKKKD